MYNTIYSISCILCLFLKMIYCKRRKNCGIEKWVFLLSACNTLNVWLVVEVDLGVSALFFGQSEQMPFEFLGWCFSGGSFWHMHGWSCIRQRERLFLCTMMYFGQSIKSVGRYLYGITGHLLQKPLWYHNFLQRGILL